MQHIRSRANDPLTSFMAADSAKQLAKLHADLIVQCLKQYGPAGKDRIARLTGLEGNQIARRLSEIAKESLIELTGELVASNAGRSEREWRIKPTQLTLL